MPDAIPKTLGRIIGTDYNMIYGSIDAHGMTRVMILAAGNRIKLAHGFQIP
jgi:hypothetical protein